MNPNAQWNPEPLHELIGLPAMDVMFQSLSSQGTASDFVALLLCCFELSRMESIWNGRQGTGD